jgi:hypothetical protein
MKPLSSVVRVHRILGFLAVLHSVLIFAVFFGVIVFAHASWSFRFNHLWVWFATLWFLWPLVLAFHPGRSVLRLIVPLVIALPFLILCLREYRASAPNAFGLPDGIQFSPYSILEYLKADRIGRAEAEKNLRSGHLAIEIYGYPMKGEREYGDILRQRYQIEFRRVAGDTNISAKVIGHAKGYNEVSEPEIKRRFGGDILKAAEEEAAKHYDEKFAQ